MTAMSRYSAIAGRQVEEEEGDDTIQQHATWTTSSHGSGTAGGYEPTEEGDLDSTGSQEEDAELEAAFDEDASTSRDGLDLLPQTADVAPSKESWYNYLLQGTRFRRQETQEQVLFAAEDPALEPAIGDLSHSGQDRDPGTETSALPLPGLTLTTLLPQPRLAPHDGVFVNLSAKPDRPSEAAAQIEEKHPPSYDQAAADAAPSYWETTVVSHGLEGNGAGGYPFGSGPDDPIVDGLPVGNVFAFIWNLLVSMSFQFVGFLLTHLLYTTHAAKEGSRAGLGVTLVQYGYYLRGRQDRDNGDEVEEPSVLPDLDDGFQKRSTIDRQMCSTQDCSPPLPGKLELASEAWSPYDNLVQSLMGYQTEKKSRVPHRYPRSTDRTLASLTSLPAWTPRSFRQSTRYLTRRDGLDGGDIHQGPTTTMSANSPEVLAYILMAAGWIILLRSLIVYWRVRKMGGIMVMRPGANEDAGHDAWTHTYLPQTFRRLFQNG